MNAGKQHILKKIGEQTALILLLEGKDAEGNEGYIYFAVRTDRFKAFKKATANGKLVNLEDYGEILESGPGKPTDEVKARMTEKYNFNHEDAQPV